MINLFFISSVVFALLFGFFAWKVFYEWKQQSRYKNNLLSNGLIASLNSHGKSIDGEGVLNIKVLNLMQATSNVEQIRRVQPNGENDSLEQKITERFPFTGSLLKSGWFCSHVDKTGVGEQVTERGFCLTRLRLTLMFSAVGALVGVVFSTELCILLLLVGMIVGWRLPRKTLSQRIEHRTHQMEHHLPEMLDVVALGMRSGLSFDASLKLYTAHFKTYLAQEFSSAQRQWLSGLEYRDAGLRKIADSYDSQIFKRVIETIVRSIRFGSSMVESLEEQSSEARVVYRAKREEQTAKAPVKMMIPTGTLILPAMLIMVVGPVLLELMGGGL